MYSYDHQIRVRYAETDQMSYVYNGAYATYLEVGRVEAIRNLGIVYKDLELQGVIMPVLELNIKYFRPARYDNIITVRTIINEMPNKRIRFDFELYNEEDVMLTKAFTTLVFVSSETGTPVEIPENLKEALLPFFN